jgi:hypothetical protein
MYTAIGNILGQFGIFCGHLVFFPVLVSCTKKNLATLRGLVNCSGYVTKLLATSLPTYIGECFITKGGASVLEIAQFFKQKSS